MTIEAIEVYFACLENPNVLDYYAEVIDGMNALRFDATNAKQNTEFSNWDKCVPLVNWHGSFLMLPGS